MTFHGVAAPFFVKSQATRGDSTVLFNFNRKLVVLLAKLFGRFESQKWLDRFTNLFFFLQTRPLKFVYFKCVQ